ADLIGAQQTNMADWSGPVLDQLEQERRQILSTEQLAERQVWRDRNLMALAAHKSAMSKK
ncbi:MAG TPA: 3-hydroxyacyl-CoA dehydrogenase, partial [Alphaproteobacteria bacterium]|nr:3-hydroxyacyl-CoA dehydrogenase [Alphaproteobacteria bacterium]